MGNHWYPDGTGITLTTMDGVLDLADISWQCISPCGCVSGLTVAATSDLYVTAEMAARGMCENDLMYQRDLELGFTWRPREHHAACDELTHDCPHTPKWGVPVVPVPADHVWATVHCLGSTTKLKHLVPQAAVDQAKARQYGADQMKPICGGKAAFWWNDEWHATSGKVECKRCATKATKIAGLAVVA